MHLAVAAYAVLVLRSVAVRDDITRLALEVQTTDAELSCMVVSEKIEPK